MAISDDAKQRTKKSPRSRSVKTPGKWWSDSQKIEAVKAYLVLGSIPLVSATLHIPEPTLRVWCKSDWWAQVVDDLRLQDELVLSARLQKLVDKSLVVVEDRLDQGDFVYDQKTGAMRRKPVAMRDAHKVALDLANKRELLLNRERPVQSQEQVADKLLKLAEKFEQLAGKAKLEANTIEADVTDVEDKNDRNPENSISVPDDNADNYREEEFDEVDDEDGGNASA